MQFLKNHTAEHIERQYNRFMQIITSFKSTDRVVHLVRMYEDLADQLMLAPASSKFHRHSAYPGGYLDHVLNVHDTAFKMVKIYSDMGGTVNFSKDEVAFCALHHDLGKLGDNERPFYLEDNDSRSHEKGYFYKYNDDLPLKNTFDRTMFLFNHYGIQISQNEMITIRLTDGLYDESNKRYFMGKEDYTLFSDLPYLMHWADHMSTIVEKNEARRALEK
jgi:hypothetical protein